MTPGAQAKRALRHKLLLLICSGSRGWSTSMPMKRSGVGPTFPATSGGRRGAAAESPHTPRRASAMNLTAIWKLFTDAFTEWTEDTPFQLAALSYYTLFSLAPLLLSQHSDNTR